MVAALYDIHGNLPALEAVLAEIQREDFEQIVVGGDVVSGPMPAAVLDCLANQDLPVSFIQGNADLEVLLVVQGKADQISPDYLPETQWVAQQLQPQHLEQMSGWSQNHPIWIKGLGLVDFYHATPRNNHEIFTRLTPEECLLPLFSDLEASVVVCGHTHMPFDRRVGRVQVVNAGSVGIPYGQSGAHWLQLGPSITHRQTVYDLESAVQRFRASGYPKVEIFIDLIKNPPSEAEVLAVFEPLALK